MRLHLILFFILAVFPSLAEALPDLQGYDNGTNHYFDVQTNPTIWGGTLTIQFAVANFSTTDAAGATTVQIMISKSATFGGSDSRVVATLPINPTPAGQAIFYLPQNIVLPSTNPFGDSSSVFYIGMSVNPSHTVAESNYANNINLGVYKDSADHTVTITPPQASMLVTFTPASSTQLTTINLGNVVVDGTGGTSVTAPVTIQDFGTGPLSITSISVTGTGFKLGTILSDYTNLPQPITYPQTMQANGGEGWLVPVIFDPTIVGSQTGTLTITGTDPNNASRTFTSITTLQANGVPIAHLVTTPSNQIADFGSVVNDGPGGIIGTQTILLTNQGSGPLSVSANGISLTTTQSGVWSIVSISNSANLANSGFEYPAVGTGNSQLQPAGATWTFSGRAFIEANGSSLGAPNAPDGTQAVMLQGLPSNTLGAISQVVNFPVATTATVSFKAAQRSGFPAQPIKFTVDGTQIDGLITPTSTSFQTYTTASFSVTAGNHTIQFSATDNSAEKDSFIDSVTVNSTTQGIVDLSSAKTMSANGAETWSVVVKFDPTANTSYLSGLQILSNDPNFPTTNCTLKGVGVIPMTLSVASAVNGVTDSNPLIMPFGSLHATGQQQLTGTVTLTNTGQQQLAISGISLGNNTDYHITGIQSSTQGTLSTNGTGTIAPNGAESWIVTVVFKPVTPQTPLNTQLTIVSNDPSHGTTPIALNGAGLNQAGIVVTNSSSNPSGTTVPYGPALNDGAGGRVATQTFIIQNIGLQSLTIPANGVHLSNATGFSIQSIASSTQPSLNLASVTSSGGSISANQAETWTVTVAFDPTANISYTGNLTIQTSNDPLHASITESLSGSGTTPTITIQPQSGNPPTLYIPAGQVYNITWAASYPITNSTTQITFNPTIIGGGPASGFPTIATIPYNSNVTTYAWRPAASLVGYECNIAAIIQDGTVSNTSVSSQRIHIEPAGSFNLQSSLITATPNYSYQYLYNGKLYAGTVTLTSGVNVIPITTNLAGGGTVTHQITVKLVPSLLAAQGYTYDELGRVKTYTDGNGITTTYLYDLAGDLTQTSATNGKVVSYTYDNLKRKLSMTDSSGTTFYDYDDLDRLSDVIYSTTGNKTDSSNLTLVYQYDNAHRMTDLTYPGGEHMHYTWDDAGRMLTANDLTTGQNTTYNYDYTKGLLHSVTRASGVVTTYGYNNVGLVNDIKHTKGSTTLAEYSYTLDSNGNVKALLTTFPGGSQKQELYTYDGLQRLVQVVYGSTATASANDKTVIYSYDGVGNRLTQTTKVNGVATQTLTYIYGSENRLLKVVDQTGAQIASYVYDAAGNRIQKVTPNGTTYYAYDENNLMTNFLSPTDNIVNTYNGMGQRVAQNVNGVTTKFVIDPTQNVFQVAQEYSGGALTKSYLYAADRLNANVQGNTPQFYLTDRLGSVRLITDQTGSVVSSFNYDVFGATQP